MAVIEYDSYKQKLLAMDETFENLFKALEIEQARQECKFLLCNNCEISIQSDEKSDCASEALWFLEVTLN